MIDQEFLKSHRFSNSQIETITEEEYSIIRNFFNIPEIQKLKPEQVIKSVKILAPILSKVEIVDMQLYVESLRKQSEMVEPDKVLDDYPEKSIVLRGRGVKDQSNEDTTQQEFDRLLKKKYFVEQVWILEHLINNPNLFMKGEKGEAIKNKLKEKELELSVHNTVLKLFIDNFNSNKNINQLFNIRHFAPLKEILESRKQILLRRNPVNFRGLIEVFEEFGFEENQELNEGMCLILAEIIDNQKLEKILRFGVQNFKEVKFVTEKRKVIAKLFKINITPTVR